MSYILIVRPKAEQHVTEAYNWYEEKLSGLGDEFLLSVDACFQGILRNPQTFQKRHKDVRAALTKKIIIIAVFHLSRNPNLWKKSM